MNTNAEALKRNYLELTELKEVLLKTQNFFIEVSISYQGILIEIFDLSRLSIT